jgi:2-keto-4-pentenoate hydratase/2-oxohepta-3-ene-1,7-dioic acid hydratase in catechol pathway
MKLVTYTDGGGRASPGVLSPDQKSVIDLGDRFPDMLALIDAGDAGLDAAHKRLSSGDRAIPLQSVKLLAPIPRPRQLRDFNNDPTHMRDAGKGLMKLKAQLDGKPAPAEGELQISVPEVYFKLPLFYFSNRYTVVGHEADIRRPSYCARLDYELEMAMVIGREGKDISQSEARNYIFGYSIFNDVTARDRQMLEMAGHLGPSKGKSFDSGNVIGPWIVTRDEIERPFDLKVEVRINGSLVGQHTGKDMVHSFEAMIAAVSRNETLYPGEIFGSGTYGGCSGLETGRFLTDGDVIELEIERIGVLRNKVIPA